MEAETVEALARAQGIKLPEGAAAATAALLKPLAPKLRESAARIPFDDEPATLLKVLRP